MGTWFEGICKGASCTSAVVVSESSCQEELPVLTVGTLSWWKWHSLMDSPWFPCGLERPNSRSLRKSLELVSLDKWKQIEHGLTLSHSRRQRLRFAGRGCRIHQQCRPRPNGTLAFGPGRGRNLRKGSAESTECVGEEYTAPGISIS